MGVVLVVTDGNWSNSTADVMQDSMFLFGESPKSFEQSATVSGSSQYCQLCQESAREVKKHSDGYVHGRLVR